MNKDQPTLKDLLRAQKDLPALDLDPIKKLLDKDMPSDIDESQVGSMKLHGALAKKFGPDYMTKAEVKRAVDHYKKEVQFMKLYKKTLGARHGI